VTQHWRPRGEKIEKNLTSPKLSTTNKKKKRREERVRLIKRKVSPPRTPPLNADQKEANWALYLRQRDCPGGTSVRMKRGRGPFKSQPVLNQAGPMEQTPGP